MSSGSEDIVGAVCRGWGVLRNASRAAALLLAALLLCHCAAPRSVKRFPVMDSSLTSWTARDGKSLPFKYWPAEPGHPRALVICIHGLSGAASDFWPAGESFPAQGIAVFGMQLRGQGNDPDRKRRGDIRSSRQWREDLMDFTALVRQRHPGLPVYWFGESLGALITIDATAALPENQKTVAGIILASPVVALRNNLKLTFGRNLMLRAILRLLPGKRLSLEAIGNSEVQVTSKTTHRGQMQHTEHYVKDFTVRLFGEVEKLIRQAAGAARHITVPVLVLYTPNDALTPREGVERFFASLASLDKINLFFPESYHLILHDINREEALRKLSQWLLARTGRPDGAR